MTRAGHTRIARTALQKTVEAIAARAYRVDVNSVKADLDDDSGKLGVSISVKLAMPLLQATRSSAGNSPRATVFEKAQAVRTELVARGRELTGMELGRVDIRLLGAKTQQPKEGRVQ